MDIREIIETDNVPIASIIRNALKEFGANKPGTVFFDPTTDDLFNVFHIANSRYFILEEEGDILGGAGIYPTQGLEEDTCELVKMYLKPEARGKGYGKLLIERALSAAHELGYKKVYIESMPELKRALSMYEKLGFKYLDGPLGNSGHTGCDRWMIKDLE